MTLPQQQDPVQPDTWQALQSSTPARIALGSTGVSIPLKEVLAFRLSHAHARDAVYSELDTAMLSKNLSESFQIPVHWLQSQAQNRHEYLQRPDKGRRLDAPSAAQLQAAPAGPFDVAFTIADGLSATAINHHAIPVLRILIPLLQASNFSIAPLCVVRQGRVAIGDETGALIAAKFSVVLIGERPGLSSPDSMGAYLTYGPAIGLTDESRNCVSNIRPEGLDYVAAAEKIYYLLTESFKLQYSGVALKDNAGLLKSDE